MTTASSILRRLRKDSGMNVEGIVGWAYYRAMEGVERVNMIVFRPEQDDWGEMKARTIRVPMHLLLALISHELRRKK